MIFKQERIGKDYKPFTIYKIKTIDDEGNIIHPFLRRTGLDELPQIWNIIKGDMRLFGPRPEVPEEDLIQFLANDEWYMRYKVKPGLIGLAQIDGCIRSKDRFSHENKVRQARLDAEMIENMGVRMRIKILKGLPSAILQGQTS